MIFWVKNFLIILEISNWLLNLQNDMWGYKMHIKSWKQQNLIGYIGGGQDPPSITKSPAFSPYFSYFTNTKCPQSPSPVTSSFHQSPSENAQITKKNSQILALIMKDLPPLFYHFNYIPPLSHLYKYSPFKSI